MAPFASGIRHYGLQAIDVLMRLRRIGGGPARLLLKGSRLTAARQGGLRAAEEDCFATRQLTAQQTVRGRHKCPGVAAPSALTALRQAAMQS